MTMTTTSARIDQFARDVRAALKDLDDTEVSELTEGLEADLRARAVEQGDSFTLLDPRDYARELREAAGIPTSGRGLVGRVERLTRRVTVAVTSNRFLTVLGAWFGSVAPLWWVARAYIAAFVVLRATGRFNFDVLPTAGLGWILLFAFVVLSIELGRRGRSIGRVATRLVVTGNVVAVLLLPLTLAAAGGVAHDALSQYRNPTAMSEIHRGLEYFGAPVYNIYAYNAKGEPLRDVQLYLPSGEPLGDDPYPYGEVGQTETIGGKDYAYVRSPKATGLGGWNIYPLHLVSMADWQAYEASDDPSSYVVNAPLPFPLAPALSK